MSRATHVACNSDLALAYLVSSSACPLSSGLKLGDGVDERVRERPLRRRRRQDRGVDLVPRAEAHGWLEARRREGLVLDVKVFAALWLAETIKADMAAPDASSDD